MEFGSCFLLLATPDDPLAIRAIPTVRACGYDYAEVSLARLYDLEDEAVIRYREAFEREKLPVRVFNNGVPADLCVIAEEEMDERTERWIRRSIHLAKLLGVDTITMSGPNRRTTPAEIDWQTQGRERYIRVVRAYAKACEMEKMQLLIEPINANEMGFIATLSQAEEIVRAADVKSLGVIVDYYHFLVQKDSYDDLLRLCKDGTIRHVHFAAPETRGYPVPAQQELYNQVLRDMLRAGYAGRISIEAHVDQEKLPEQLRTGLQCLKIAVESGKSDRNS